MTPAPARPLALDDDASADDTVSRRLAQYQRRGWCPVPWRHQPVHVKAAIRAARVVPKMKGCFENSQRIVLRQQLVPFTYTEGWVTSARVPFPFQHGWLTDANGERVDLTLDVADVLPLVSWTVSFDVLRMILVARRFFGPALLERFNETHATAWETLAGKEKP